MAFPFHVTEHVIASQHVREWPRATANSQEEVLWLSVKQYTPVDNPTPQPGDVTIIGAHANGFPKELYEALWADLHAAARRHGFRIRGIWIADVTNQGRSAALNEPALGDDPAWFDHPRDLLHMTNVFRADMPRPLVGVGHSFGGSSLVQLSLLHPRLLTTLVLMDPVITRFGFTRVGPGISPARLSAFRRDRWPSRAAAQASFASSPFYTAWDPRVLAAWNEHGIRPTPSLYYPDDTAADGAVTLTTPRHQEVFTFLRPLFPHVGADGRVDRDGAPDFDPAVHDPISPDNPYQFYRAEGPETLQRLPSVRPSVLWLFAGEGGVSPPEARRLKMETTGTGPGGSGGAREGRVADVVVHGRGHLFPMEIPAQCADWAADWIGREMARWRQAEQGYRDWTKKPLIEKASLSQEVLDHIGAPPRRERKTPEGGESKL